MYEKKNGSARLVAALERAAEDEAALRRMAAALNYLPEQLKEDIQALRDFKSEADAAEQEEN